MQFALGSGKAAEVNRSGSTEEAGKALSFVDSPEPKLGRGLLSEFLRLHGGAKT